MPIKRFHEHRGQNIQLREDGTVACRVNGFAHAICFSEQPLKPGEVFLIEIAKDELGWNGHMRIGLTQCDPGTNFPLPQYTLPDLVSLVGKSWVYAVTQSNSHVHIEEDVPDRIEDVNRPARKLVLGHGDVVVTSHESFSRLMLYGQRPSTEAVLPTEVGSRIGLVYTVRDDSRGQLYLVVNGEECGPCTQDIDCNAGPLWVVVDVYGTTKEVKIVQLHEVDNLQTQCRHAVLKLLKKASYVEVLPLPRKMKDFLLYRCDSEE